MHIYHDWQGEGITSHIICDQCGDYITPDRPGIYLYTPDTHNAATHFVHKGKCDIILQRRLGLTGAPWDEISTLIKRLAPSLSRDSIPGLIDSLRNLAEKGAVEAASNQPTHS